MRMSSHDINERPAKKRRFFFDDDAEGIESSSVDASPKRPGNARNGNQDVASDSLDTALTETATAEDQGFDIDLFSSFVGRAVPEETVRKLRGEVGDNLERAINLYLDGSWDGVDHRRTELPAREQHPISTVDATENAAPEPAAKPEENDKTLLNHEPKSRYIGAFGVAGWSTTSGTNVIKYGDEVNIRRSKVQVPRKIGKDGRLSAKSSNQKLDVLTRFTNANGSEIGRLPQETANWVSTLIDHNICSFTGSCVYAPDRVRINDTIYIQLKCYLLKDALRESSTAGLEEDTGAPRIFEQQETAEEKALRLRQVALVTLFDEIGLVPTSTNELAAKHKKEGMLRAAEIAEQHAKVGQSSSTQQNNDDGSTDNEEGEELDEDQLDSLYKKAQDFDFSMEEATPAENFSLNLRNYQKQGLHWMLGKEKDVKRDREESMHPLWEEYAYPTKDFDDNPLPRVRGKDKFYVNPYSGELSLKFPVQEQNCLGGILADEMGLGKTIEVMSLIHSHIPEVDAPSNSGPPMANIMDRPSSSEPIFAPRTTLVVAPTSLLSQWENEAYKASKEGTMKVLVYYGTDRYTDLAALCSPGNPNAPNLIVTSYGVVRSQHGQARSTRSSSMSTSGLFSVDYFRIILDEAHCIKNRASKSAKACYDLKGKHRWVLTGTPIINRLEDLYSLVRFLKVEPWCNFSFWRTFITVPFESKDFVRALNVVQTVLEPLVLRRTKTMKTPDGEPLVPLPSRTITIEEIDLSDQEREIYDIIFTRAKRTFNDNVAAGTLLKSYTTIFAQILRLRQTCCHPVLTRNQTLVAEEEDAAVAADKLNMLQDDMDLQDLINKFSASQESNDTAERDPTANFTAHALKQIQTESSGECPICSEEPMIDPALTGCWHSACRDCLESYIKHQTNKGEKPRCFSCRDELNTRDIFEIIRHKSPGQSPPNDTQDQTLSIPPTSDSPAPRISIRRVNPLSPSAHTSAKIQALLNHLSKLPPNTKSVVFSQFTSFLDLIAPQLTRAGISHLRFDGSMSQKARAAVLTQFNSTDIFDEDEDSDDSIEYKSRPARQTKLDSTSKQTSPSVLLISLKAGGVGLNLTAANHVYMMDPWWSFAVEAQAIDRVHRMGQLRDVSVTRFVVKKSIEGRMLRVQDRKAMIAGSLGLKVGGDGGEEERKKERIEELKLLFE